jgi:hypothetical protein
VLTERPAPPFTPSTLGDSSSASKRAKAPTARSEKYTAPVEDIKGVAFEDGDWVATVKGGEPLISASQISSRSVRVRVVVDEVRRRGEAHSLACAPCPMHHVPVGH